MGCFSFMCQKCEKPINSDSFTGELVELFLLKEGKVLEHLSGTYNSYGNTFEKKWDMPWSDVCDLMFSKYNSNGIATIHSRCYDKSMPTIRSEDDPDQGWGAYTPNT